VVTFKRRVYGAPLMKFYRDWRSRQIASKIRQTQEGFRFAGYGLFYREDWEVEERSIVNSLLPKSDVFLDVGASHGYYACLAAHAGVQTAAIEAEQNSLKVLMGNVLVNGFNNVEVFPVAVARHVGISKFYGDGDCASLDREWAGVGQEFSQLVACNTLDNLFADRWTDRQLLIKIDVEGLEAEVLAGAGGLIGRSVKPYWLIESFPRQSNADAFKAVFETMFSVGYSALVADRERTRVSPEMVTRWAADLKAPGRASSNFLFFDEHTALAEVINAT
jgi:FkbM family methyltransferase